MCRDPARGCIHTTVRGESLAITARGHTNDFAATDERAARITLRRNAAAPGHVDRRGRGVGHDLGRLALGFDRGAVLSEPDRGALFVGRNCYHYQTLSMPPDAEGILTEIDLISDEPIGPACIASKAE